MHFYNLYLFNWRTFVLFSIFKKLLVNFVWSLKKGVELDASLKQLYINTSKYPLYWVFCVDILKVV